MFSTQAEPRGQHTQLGMEVKGLQVGCCDAEQKHTTSDFFKDTSILSLCSYREHSPCKMRTKTTKTTSDLGSGSLSPSNHLCLAAWIRIKYCFNTKFSWRCWLARCVEDTANLCVSVEQYVVWTNWVCPGLISVCHQLIPKASLLSFLPSVTQIRTYFICFTSCAVQVLISIPRNVLDLSDLHQSHQKNWLKYFC